MAPATQDARARAAPCAAPVRRRSARTSPRRRCCVASQPAVVAAHERVDGGRPARHGSTEVGDLRSAACLSGIVSDSPRHCGRQARHEPRQAVGLDLVGVVLPAGQPGRAVPRAVQRR